MSHRVLLLSGGLDSAVLLAWSQHARLPYALALHVNYGQPAAILEAQAAERLAAHYGTELVRAQVRVPGWHPNRSDPRMVVPGRNAVLLALAAAAARAHGIAYPQLVLGANADDQADYEDCRPEYLNALAGALACDVKAPLAGDGKAYIGSMARGMDVPWASTWSCYYPSLGRPCGQCNACAGHRAAAL